jgi:hypothetical protein
VPIYFILDGLELQFFQIQLHLFPVFYRPGQLESLAHDTILGFSDDILNLRERLAGSAAAFRPSIWTSMDIIVRAFGGSNARKLRAVLPDLPLNGENLALTEVMYLAVRKKNQKSSASHYAVEVHSILTQHRYEEEGQVQDLLQSE